ncbi:MAG TPA: peptidoglycan editing factor PgeF [Bacillota bacterium]|nr:peptidoglycan editing factor PgeF [Bacillota bacterium]
MSWQIQCYHGVEVYQALSLNDSGLIQGFSTQNAGNLALHTGDMPEKVIERRRDFLKVFGLKLEQLVAANQVHGTTIRKVDRQLAGAGALSFATALPETDALITEIPGIVLSIFTADCLPVFLYDPDTPAIAVIHAGWRGTLGRIAEKTLERMVDEYQTTPGRLRAAIGPAICRHCFQVNQDLADEFSKDDPLAVESDSTTASYVDLPGFNARLLAKAGVAPENIDLSGACTSCQTETFFSYRAGNRTIGRMMGIISLK